MKNGMTRREFLKTTAIAGTAMLVGGGGNLFAQTPGYHDSFLIKNVMALVGEPQTFKLCDILIQNGIYTQIVELASNPGGINPDLISPAPELINSTSPQLYASPGWVDMHVHIGLSGYGYPINDMGLAHGVTALVDAGSAGYSNFYVVNNAINANPDIDCFALLNINPGGVLGGVWLTPNITSIRNCINTYNANRKTIVGLKHRADLTSTRSTDREYFLRQMRDAAFELGIPSVAHINSVNNVISLEVPNILDPSKKYLRTGDILCHAMREDDNSITYNGSVRSDVWNAYRRGIRYDVAHGGASFSFSTAEAAIHDVSGEFRDFTVSSDIYLFSKAMARSFANVLTKFLVDGINMELNQIMINASTKPAGFLGIERIINEGAEATMTIFSIKEGNFTMEDTLSQTRNCTKRIIPEWTIMRGNNLYRAGDYDRGL